MRNLNEENAKSHAVPGSLNQVTQLQSELRARDEKISMLERELLIAYRNIFSREEH